MALSKLSGDEQGIILGQLRNTLEPRLAMYFSSASKELRALLPPAVQQQLRTDYEAATALCLKVGMRDCKELREATKIDWDGKGLSAADLATLATLGSLLPALEYLILGERSGSAGLDGVPRLAEGLVAGALPALTMLIISGMHVGDAGAAAVAAALDRGALPRLQYLSLLGTAIGDAALAALAPALRRRPALKDLSLGHNPFGDEGLAALVAPPPAAGTPPAGGLKQLKGLRLGFTQITDAGCATLAAALDSGALPALERLSLAGNPLGDEGLAALVAPPPPAGTPLPPAGGLKQLKVLDLDGTQITDAGCATLVAASHLELLHLERLGLSGTQITDAGCATLVAALDSGALPALEKLELVGIPASVAARDAVSQALASD